MTLSLIQKAEELKARTGRLFIDGKWIDWNGEWFEQIQPATNEVIAKFPEAGAEGVDMAVRAARRAFDEGSWSTMPAQDRKRFLQRIIDKMYQHAEELDALQTLDNGTPFYMGRNSRMSAEAAAEVFEHYAGWCDKITGETYPQFSSVSNMHYLTVREPVGVVGAILAWNAPLRMFALKVAPALATGCTVIAKPSENTNMVANRLAEIVAECDLPPGVFNFVTGAGKTGSALSAHPGVDKISFTGSAAVGERITAVSGTNMKRLSLELGGKSAGIVFPDVKDLKKAACYLMGVCSTFMSGQICSTPSRALVHKSLLDEFIEHATEQARSVSFGDPFAETTTSAPMITRRHLNTVREFINTGVAEGAKLLFGGETPKGELENGNWINPALFIDVNNTMTIAREEIFGPVLSVIPFETEEEAVRIANDSQYGLSGVVFTNDINRAFRVSRCIRSGSVGINGYASVANAPMGGVKRSGVGREGGWPAIEAFTELKTITINFDF